MKKKIAFLGSKKIGFECLKILHYNSFNYDYEIAGVLTNNRGKEISEFCISKNIPLLKFINLRL